MEIPQNSQKEQSKGKAMPKALLGVLIVALFLISMYGVYSWQHNKIDELNTRVANSAAQLDVAKKQNQQPSNTYTSRGGVAVKVYIPQSNTKVVSPIEILGEVPGNWSFEASFPIQLKDSKGKVVAQASAKVLGEWMTDQLVPFSAQLVFTSKESGTGTLILQKDNPSGLAKNDDDVSIPIRF